MPGKTKNVVGMKMRGGGKVNKMRGGGKVMMAHLPEERLARILARGLPSLTKHTITDPQQLRSQLHRIQQVGYGIAEQELEEGLSAVASAIWNHDGQVVAVISVSGPSFRLPGDSLEELGVTVKQAADSVSRKIGYLGKNGRHRGEQAATDSGS